MSAGSADFSEGNEMNTIAFWTAMAWAGWLITTGSLLALYGVTGLIGKEVWKRMKRIYQFSVLAYWLNRMENEGTHVVRRDKGESDA